MNEPYDTRVIEDRIAVFTERFSELTARYDEFGKMLNLLHERIQSHLEEGEEALEIAREAQNHAQDKKGFEKWTSRRNQGRINAKLLGAIERNFAMTRDLQVLSARNLELIADTGHAVKRDVRELMDSMVQTVRDFHLGTSRSLSLMAVDIEMLKELASQQTLKNKASREDI